jgi:hypothetical protein
MKIPLAILGIVMALLFAFQLLAPTPGPDMLQARTDLPWQITVNAEGGSRVFDLDLGQATLQDAIDKFGGVEGLAVFETENGTASLEAFFGTVRFGPLNAKVVTTLEASAEELRRLVADNTTDRQGSPSGDWKYPLSDGPAEHAERRLSGITYIPGTRNLDKAFLRERFGEPAATLRESEQAVSWFYPELGLSILIDDDAREVLEYRLPRDFVTPQDAILSTATR